MDYLDTLIKRLGTVSVASSFLAQFSNTGIGTNQINVLAEGTSGFSGVLKQMVVDTNQKDPVLAFEMELLENDANLTYVPYVYTYKATAPAVGSQQAPALNGYLLYTLGRSTAYAAQGKVIVPNLDLAPGETQYLAIGWLSNGLNTTPLVYSINAKLHLSDVQCFQPSK